MNIRGESTMSNDFGLNIEELTQEKLDDLTSKNGLIKILKSDNEKKYKKLLKTIHYENELEKLQVELIKLQMWVEENNKRILIIFEGRDGAGKGGAIKRFTEHLSPRSMRVVALPKPSDVEKMQWYFQRYTKQLPDPGEICFFDRSWYNRAVVEPVMGFCEKDQYNIFMQQVPEFEHMLVEDGIIVVKFWFSITKTEQEKRFNERKTNPLKHWKLSPVDQKAQDMWDLYTDYKEVMFSKTHTTYCPWIVVEADNKKQARLEAIRYVLSVIDYDGKEESQIDLNPDPNIVSRYYRKEKEKE
jgi:polyphosphate kinase 2